MEIIEITDEDFFIIQLNVYSKTVGRIELIKEISKISNLSLVEAREALKKIENGKFKINKKSNHLDGFQKSDRFYINYCYKKIPASQATDEQLNDARRFDLLDGRKFKSLPKQDQKTINEIDELIDKLTDQGKKYFENKQQKYSAPTA